MDEYFPIECQECSHVTWINRNLYFENPKACIEDCCPICDYSKFLSLAQLAGDNPRSEYLQSKFDELDFYIGMSKDIKKLIGWRI